MIDLQNARLLLPSALRAANNHAVWGLCDWVFVVGSTGVASGSFQQSQGQLAPRQTHAGAVCA